MFHRLREKRATKRMKREQLSAEARQQLYQLCSLYAAEQGYPAYDPTIHVLR